MLIRNEKIKNAILFLMLSIIPISLLSGCEQTIAKQYGGDMTIELPVNQKLEMITWKDNSLWYLTKPMTDGDIAETHTFKQSSEFGVFEGTITIIETLEDIDEKS